MHEGIGGTGVVGVLTNGTAPAEPVMHACGHDVHVACLLGAVTLLAQEPDAWAGIGGTDPELYRAAAEAGRVARDVPVNHSGTFAPVVQPTLDTGTRSLVVAALAWLGSEART